MKTLSIAKAKAYRTEQLVKLENCLIGIGVIVFLGLPIAFLIGLLALQLIIGLLLCFLVARLYDIYQKVRVIEQILTAHNIKNYNPYF